ncbi:MAG: hypothetical protein COB67_02915 [SAR324 cluster bacterium]|uniref:Adenylate cyclase class-I N-terminal domain-containing protein n=1 Tax=SAR324 cluster bacterium TaxID=2024889 RepID=A0A2A4T9P6_9DELT|nr:MAG: hypothetical protein COB67_02915 [SAR324 cluster bacterium]
MKLKDLFFHKKSKKADQKGRASRLKSSQNKKQKSVPSPAPRREDRVCQIFRQGIELNSNLLTRLRTEAQDGATFFREYNESRIKLAFDAFDLPMRYALFEIIFLLNINDKRFKSWSFTKFQDGNRGEQNEGEELIADIYVEGGPFGVKGIEQVSQIFHKEFNLYCQKTFGESPLPVNDPNPPIDGIYSIGSIGTIGHKPITSDLDLEVQYDLTPFLFEAGKWDDSLLTNALKTERNYLIERYLQKRGLPTTEKLKPEQRKKISAFFTQHIAKNYPCLFHQLISKKHDFVRDIEQEKEGKVRNKLIQEVIKLMKRNLELTSSAAIKEQENLLKQRITKVQDYVQRKFPEAEVYLFPFSVSDFRRGYFGSTLESKESSGGAYELILNYDTLMPGIFFTSSIPIHFLIPPEINNNLQQCEKLIDYLRFQLLDFYGPYCHQLTHQGHTPNLDINYVAKHYTAVYWEAFKASSGNLPKATLNLLRYEMLLEGQVGKTIIQLIKEPYLLDEFVTNQNGATEDEAGENFSPASLLQLEEEFPLLHRDPWWLRYKALKIAYSIPGLIAELPADQTVNISDLLDVSFALHVRVSDVFRTPGDSRKFDSHREQVLIKFLAVAFPEFSARRNQLHAIFIGDVQTVNEYEVNLRTIFQNSVERIHQKIAKLKLQGDETSSKEFEIWFHYYLKSFKPMPNVVQRSILNHLQTPRGRLQIGFKGVDGWFFRSLQKGSSAGKRFQSDILSMLPNETLLLEKTGFLQGLVYCVINGYYGIFNKGRLDETKTIVEFDRRFSHLENDVDNNYAYVRPDQIDRIMTKILAVMKPLKVSYLDCIRTERKIQDVMIFLNLLKFGELAILYRDNLNTIFVDRLEVPGFDQQVKEFINSAEAMFRVRILHQVLKLFFKDKEIDPAQVNLTTWVNLNSVESSQSMTKNKEREQDLAEKFKKIILKKFA